MGEPCHRMAADAAIALGDIRPVDVLFQPEKDTRSALVCALGQHDLVTFAECRTNRSGAQHVRLPPSFGGSSTAPELWSKLRLVKRAWPSRTRLAPFCLPLLSVQLPFQAQTLRSCSSHSAPESWKRSDR